MVIYKNYIYGLLMIIAGQFAGLTAKNIVGSPYGLPYYGFFTLFSIMFFTLLGLIFLAVEKLTDRVE